MQTADSPFKTGHHSPFEIGHRMAVQVKQVSRGGYPEIRTTGDAWFQMDDPNTLPECGAIVVVELVTKSGVYFHQLPHWQGGIWKIVENNDADAAEA